MSTYKSKPVTINRAASDIAAKFADLSMLQPVMENMPADERERIGDVQFTRDEIIINTAQVGQIKFRVTGRSPERISMEAVGSPVPLTMAVLLAAQGESSTEVTTAIDVELPAMLRPLIGGTMQKATDRFGELIAKLS